MTECSAVLDVTGEGCRKPENHAGYHRGHGGPFGPWQGPHPLNPNERRDAISVEVAATQRERKDDPRNG